MEFKSIRAITQLYINTALLYSILGDGRMTIKFLLRHLEEYEKHPEFLKNNVMNYMVGISNAIQLSSEQEDHDLFRKTFSKMEKLQMNDPQVRAFIIHQVFFNQLTQAIRNGWYDRGLILVKTYGKTAMAFLETEDQTLLLQISVYIAVVYFCVGNYDECNAVLNAILKRRWKVRPEIVAAAHVLNCLLHAETKNYEILPGLVITAKRSIKNHQLDHPSSSALLNLLLQYDKMTRREQLHAWKEFENTFIAGQEKLPDQLERISIRHWILSKIKRESN
jgi:hypothetical protein